MNNFEPRATDTKDPMRSKYAEAMNSSVPDKLNRLKGSIERVIGQFKDKVIVSIGCGTGKLEENLAKLLPAKVYAIDLSLPMLEDIKDEDNFSRKVDSGEPRWQGNLEKIQANGLSLPIPDKKADLIVVHSVVHEVNSYEAAFKMELAGKTGEFFGHLAQKLNQGVNRLAVYDRSLCVFHPQAIQCHLGTAL
jgi:SAM-dependent methyltransferase